MDIISISTAIGIAIISDLAQKVTEKENINKLVDWVLSVGEHFWSQSKPKQPDHATTPETETTESPKVEINVNLNDFSVKRRINHIISLMEQLDIYSSNLNKDLERAAKLGGINSPDMTHRLYNSIQDQKKEIVKCFIQLAENVNKVQNKQLSDLENLIKEMEELS